MKPFLQISLRLSTFLLTAFVSESALLAQGSRETRPTIFPLSKEVVHLGPAKGSAPDWAWVEAPRGVFLSARGILEGSPAEWEVGKNLNYPTPGKEVVFLEDAKNNCLVYLVKSDRWIRLNEKAGISALNEATRDLPGRDIFTANMDHLVRYAECVANFYKGRCRPCLSNHFLNKSGGAKSDAGKPWLTGKEKRPEALYELCHDPVSTRDGDRASMQFNVFVLGGGVEEWTVKGTLDHGLVIRDIEVKLIRELGTFYWDCN